MEIESAYPVHTPDRLVKRQNGPRIGERERAFTITVADRMGVLIFYVDSTSP